MKTKEEYEILINSSRLFSIDREKDEVLYKTELGFFLKTLAEYYSKYIFASRSLDSYSVELMETALECLKYYDVGKGNSFLHYFSVSLKKALLKSNAKKIVDDKRGGMTLSPSEDRLLRSMLNFAKLRGRDINDAEFQEILAERFKIDIDMVRSMVALNFNSLAVRETRLNEDGEEISIFETVSSERYAVDYEQEKADKIENAMDLCADAFLELQDRTKPIVKKLFTLYLLKKSEDDTLVEKYYRGYNFSDEDMIDEYLESGLLPRAKDIAAQFGVNEASASRTFNTFLEKIKEKYKLKNK